MTYTPTTAKAFREKAGSISQKLATEFTAIETDLNANVKVASGALTAGLVNTFAFAWENPETSRILVTRVLVDVTTAGGTATAVLDVGPAADATTHSDTLIDGVDLNAAAIYDNIDDQGTNGLSKVGVDENGGTTSFITGQILTEAASALVGNYYIFYVLV